MHRRLLTAFTFVALFALTACGDKDEGPSVAGDDPFGMGAPSTPPSLEDVLGGSKLPTGMPNMGDPEAMRKWAEEMGLGDMPNVRDPEAMRKWAEQMGKNPEALQAQGKDQLEKMGLGDMPDASDPEAMREWTKDMQERGAAMMDRFAGEVSEDDLQKYMEIQADLKGAKGDAAKTMALYKLHGGMMKIMKVIKVPVVLRAYERRRDSGRLTDKDKANAAVYEKYLKLLED